MSRQVWEVVGGSDRGGILVRSDQDLASAKFSERLSTGALVEELELQGERLHYRRIAGAGGPLEGWVSTHLHSKELLVRRSDGPKPLLPQAALAPTPAKAARPPAPEATPVAPAAPPGRKVATFAMG
mmetsp:Transcript_103329/g.221021  ORF Transcript_103329/g.221021 Transcript_103329/m.221021 type:complete len:127 (-) Transcript_103329:516-896(-)